jgi:hypothetical protein
MGGRKESGWRGRSESEIWRETEYAGRESISILMGEEGMQ